jgi:hypothetical protein
MPERRQQNRGLFRNDGSNKEQVTRMVSAGG